jgi:uncharacterized membrane protein YhaH (DUF805 family)
MAQARGGRQWPGAAGRLCRGWLPIYSLNAFFMSGVELGRRMGFLFSPFGRVSLGQVWFWFLLPVFIANVVAAVVDIVAFETAPEETGPVTALLGFALAWPSIAVSVKRYHDHGMTGWWVLIGAIALGIATASGLAAAALWADPGAAPPLLMVMTFAISAALALWVLARCYLLPGEPRANEHGPPPGDRREIAYALTPDLDRLTARETPYDETPALDEGRRRNPPMQPGGKSAFGRRGARA